jgi:sugar/nucleoside kinase (ribokinase family)
MAETARCGFVTGGTWCVDRNKLVDFWPMEDGLTEILEEEVRGGGSACNLAFDIRKLDPEMFVETIGLIGGDENGGLLLSAADAHGVEHSQLAVVENVPTHHTEAYTSRETGRRTHIFRGGAGDLLTPDHFDFARTRGRILHLGLPGVHARLDGVWGEAANGWVATLRKARAAGLMTNLELCSIPENRLAVLVRPCLLELDLLIVNDTEIGAIAGETCIIDGQTDVAACVRSARHVLAEGSMVLVVVHFPAGAVAVSRDGTVTAKPSVRVPSAAIAGTNGAGDAFAAGFLYGVHEGWHVEQSLTLAHAAAAASLRGIGTTDAVESWRHCLALAENWSWREALAGLI